MSRSAVLALIAALALSASALATGEWPVSSVRRGVPAQEVIDVSAGGNGDLLLLHWRDNRAGHAGAFGNNFRDFVVRLDAGGKLLDDADVPVPVVSPKILPLGDGFVLIGESEWATVSRSGIVSTARKIAERLPWGVRWASNGRFVFEISEAATTAVVYDAAMRVVAKKSLPLAATPFATVRVVVASEQGAGIAYEDDAGVHVAFIDTEATLKYIATPTNLRSNGSVQLATDGTRFIVMRNSFDTPLMEGWLIGADGTVLIRADAEYGGTLAWNGKWIWIRGVLDSLGNFQHAAQTYEDGRWSAPVVFSPFIAPVQVVTPRGAMLAFNLTEVLTFAGLGAPTGRHPLTTRGAMPQQFPVAANTRSGALVAWSEKHPHDGLFSLLATRVAPDGSIVDPDSIEIAADVCAATRPVIAAGNGQTFVAWIDGVGVRAARISDDGTVLDKPGLIVARAGSLCHNGGLFGAAAAGNSYLVAWAKEIPSGSPYVRYEPRFARVGAGGTVQDPEGVVIGDPFGPAAYGEFVRSDGNQFLITWWQFSPLFADGYNFAILVPPAAAPPFPALNLAPGDLVDLAWDGRQYLALRTRNGDYRTWFATSFTPSGTPVEQTLVAEDLPHVLGGWAAARLVCDGRCDLVSGTMSPLEVAVRPLSQRDGIVHLFPATSAFPLDETQQAFLQFGPSAVAVFGHGQRFVAYGRVDAELGGVFRIYIRQPLPLRRRAAAP